MLVFEENIKLQGDDAAPTCDRGDRQLRGKLLNVLTDSAVVRVLVPESSPEFAAKGKLLADCVGRFGLIEAKSDPCYLAFVAALTLWARQSQ